MYGGAKLGRNPRKGISRSHHIVVPTTRIRPAGGVPVRRAEGVSLASGIARKCSRTTGAVAGRRPGLVAAPLRRVGAVTTPARHGVVHLIHAGRCQAKVLGSALGEVENPPPRVRTPVVDGDPNGNVLCAAVKPEGSNTSPLAVKDPSKPGPYQEASPVSASARSSPRTKKAPMKSNTHNKRDNLSKTRSPSVCVSFISTCSSTSKFCGEEYLRYARGNQDGPRHYHVAIIRPERPESTASELYRRGPQKSFT